MQSYQSFYFHYAVGELKIMIVNTSLSIENARLRKHMYV